jgi:hypothetical protein
MLVVFSGTHGIRVAARIGASLLLVVSEVQCGPALPTVTDSAAHDGGASSDSDTRNDGDSTMATSAASLTTAASTGTTSPTSAGGTTDSTGATTPPGWACPEPAPPGDPIVPEGCDPVWLVDAEASALEGVWSGLVSCTSRDELDSVVYRAAAVACPQLIGDECLCDADCAQGEACICANTRMAYSNRCLPTDCAGAEDCGGAACRVDEIDCVGVSWYPEAVRCTSTEDDCVFDSACAGDGWPEFCDYDSVNEIFTCDPGALCE